MHATIQNHSLGVRGPPAPCVYGVSDVTAPAVGAPSRLWGRAHLAAPAVGALSRLWGRAHLAASAVGAPSRLWGRAHLVAHPVVFLPVRSCTYDSNLFSVASLRAYEISRDITPALSKRIVPEEVINCKKIVSHLPNIACFEGYWRYVRGARTRLHIGFTALLRCLWRWRRR